MQISRKQLKDLVYYKDGKLFRKTTDKEIGCKKTEGYYCASINKKFYYIHQLVFLYHNGYIPKVIDHIDRNRGNNIISNLRECTQKINTLNRSATRFNKTGFTGVYKSGDKFSCYLNITGKRKCLGVFNTAKEASEKYNHEKENLIRNETIKIILAKSTK